MDRFQLFIPKQLRDRLNKAVKEKGLSVSEIIRAAIEVYLTEMGL